MEIPNLYSAENVKVMQIADHARLPRKNRIEEIRNFAKIARFKRIGIANCVALQKEANYLKENLSNDFEVYAIDCKYGKIPSSTFLDENAKGISCNPAGQAAFLDDNKTELNILMGLCVGHDMVFSSKSKAPVTTLIVKDREHNHNPIAAFNGKKEV